MNEIEEKFLIHYGVKRRSGRYAYGSGNRPYQHTVFVSGSSKTESKDSEYYRRKLSKDVRKIIDKYINEGDKIIVGDAPGIDRQVQKYLKKKRYDNVEVYGPGKKVRYTANKKWKTNTIDAPEYEEGSKEWLAKKDIAMTNAADKGLAVILDEGAKATRKNIERMDSQNKPVDVYELSKQGKKKDKWVRVYDEVKRKAKANHDNAAWEKYERLYGEEGQKHVREMANMSVEDEMKIYNDILKKERERNKR